ncbi:MAG TPA: alpha/beta hydrolase, partial [Pseudorhodoplanes sp.]|nr:alpha/beta hydrolase [Pseudorhodoplanes sp.]
IVQHEKTASGGLRSVRGEGRKIGKVARTASAWVPHHVRANGIDIATYSFGSGPPVVLLHGFPELGFSWRHHVEELARAGWRVIVPDLRGFGATGAHGEPAAYCFANLARDVFGMAAALEAEKPVLVGHDVGGALAWSIARDHPHAVSGIASLNTPYTRRGRQDLVSTMRQYRGAHNYMVAFQEPGIAEKMLESEVETMFHNLFRRPALALSAFQADPHLKALPMSLFTGEATVMGESLMPPDEIEIYVGAYRRTGFSGPLAWYRNLQRNWEDGAGRDDRVEVPALMVTASDDFFLPPETSVGMEAIVADLERAEIPGCGHWTQHERPEAVNRILLDWLERRMRPLFD